MSSTLLHLAAIFFMVLAGIGVFAVRGSEKEESSNTITSGRTLMAAGWGLLAFISFIQVDLSREFTNKIPFLLAILMLALGQSMASFAKVLEKHASEAETVIADYEDDERERS